MKNVLLRAIACAIVIFFSASATGYAQVCEWAKPLVSYGTLHSDNVTVMGSATDASGSVYVTGFFNSDTLAFDNIF